MSEIVSIFTQFTIGEIIGYTVLLCLGIRGLWDFIEYVKTKIINWHNDVNEEEDEKEEIEDRIHTLEEHDDWKYTQIVKLQKGQEELNSKMDEFKESKRLEVIAQYRATIYRLHKEFMEKGYVTEMEYEMFRSLADIYLEYGGNGYYRNHVIPEIEALEIRK